MRLEGELASTIQAMDGVKLASVKLAIPEQTVFVDSKTNPTASIFVETKPGVTLSRDQVQSVVHLTSAAVDGLKPEDVSVVDSAGNLLSAAGVGLTGGVSQQTSDYETRVASSIQGMLDRVVGPGNATVAVAADMSKESAERTEETFTDPKGKPALVESEKKENYKGNGSGGPAAGVLGPDNIAVPNGTNGDRHVHLNGQPAHQRRQQGHREPHDSRRNLATPDHFGCRERQGRPGLEHSRSSPK